MQRASELVPPNEAGRGGAGFAILGELGLSDLNVANRATAGQDGATPRAKPRGRRKVYTSTKVASLREEQGDGQAAALILD